MSLSKSMLTSEEIQGQLESRTREMDEHQRLGNYVDAEKCRLQIQQLKVDFEASRQNELEQKHRNESAELARTHEQELDHFNKFWDKKIEDYHADGERLQKEMTDRHQQQQKASRDQLDKQLSTKLKQSSQLLNLRKMQEHMAKQKNYVEAQKVKQRCIELEKQEKQAWANARNLKIETAINKLRHKQQAELGALQKKIKTGMDEQNKDRNTEENRLRLKYANVCRQLKMQQQKQILAHRGQFKSKGGSTSSPTMTKSKNGFK